MEEEQLEFDFEADGVSCAFIYQVVEKHENARTCSASLAFRCQSLVTSLRSMLQRSTPTLF